MSETQKYPQDLMPAPEQNTESTQHSRRTVLKAFGAALVGSATGATAANKLARRDVAPPSPMIVDSGPINPMPEAPINPEQTREEAQANADMYSDMLNESRANATTVPLPTMPGRLIWSNPDQPGGELICEYPILLDESPVNMGEVAPPEEPSAPDSIVIGGGNYISASYHQIDSAPTDSIPRYVGSQSGNNDGTVSIEVFDTQALTDLRFEPAETIVALHGSSDRAIFDSRVEDNEPLVYATDYDGQHLLDDKGNYVMPGMMNGYK